jgi:hypothetical protein
MNCLGCYKKFLSSWVFTVVLGCGVKGPPVPYVSLDDSHPASPSKAQVLQSNGSKTESEKVKK